MKLNEFRKHIYSEATRIALNRDDLICDPIDVQSLIELTSQDMKTAAKLTSVFDVTSLSEDFKSIIDLFDNEEYDVARKKLRSLEKDHCSAKDNLVIQLLKLYADAALWSLSPEERYKTRFEDTYGAIHQPLEQELHDGLAEQFKQNAIALIRGM